MRIINQILKLISDRDPSLVNPWSQKTKKIKSGHLMKISDVLNYLSGGDLIDMLTDLINNIDLNAQVTPVCFFYFLIFQLIFYF